MSIHGLFGLAHLGLSEFHDICKIKKIDYAIATPTGLKKYTLGERKEYFPVVIIGVVNFLKIHKKLKKKVCVFIIDNPVQLEAIGASILGSSKTRSYHFRFHPVSPADVAISIDSCGEEPLKIKMKKTRIVYDMLQAATASSILSPLNTLFYRIRSQEERTSTQDVVFEWLAGKATNKKLHRIRKIEESAVADRILEVLNTPKLQRLQKACELVMEKKGTYADVSKKQKVPLFDLKYVAKRVAAKLNIEIEG